MRLGCLFSWNCFINSNDNRLINEGINRLINNYNTYFLKCKKNFYLVPAVGTINHEKDRRQPSNFVMHLQYKTFSVIKGISRQFVTLQILNCNALAIQNFQRGF